MKELQSEHSAGKHSTKYAYPSFMVQAIRYCTTERPSTTWYDFRDCTQQAFGTQTFYFAFSSTKLRVSLVVVRAQCQSCHVVTLTLRMSETYQTSTRYFRAHLRDSCATSCGFQILFARTRILYARISISACAIISRTQVRTVCSCA